MSPRRLLKDHSEEQRRRIEEAKRILQDFGFDSERTNLRSCLVFLALLDLRPEDDWSKATAPAKTVREIIRFINDNYGGSYTDREAPRRQTLHQFRDRGIVLENDGSPLETNNPAYNYRIQADALETIRAFGTKEWDGASSRYLSELDAIRDRHKKIRELHRVSVTFPDGSQFKLGPGKHNELIASVVEDFSALHLEQPVIVYVGDAGDKNLFVDHDFLAKLGVTIDAHGKLPDVIIFDRATGWLVLVEAVTSHGPMSPARKQSLASLFAGCESGLVYVTAFRNRKEMAAHLADLAWETEVWFADDAEHLVHFNGDRFLGPHDS